MMYEDMGGRRTKNDIRKTLRRAFRVRSWKLFLMLIPLVVLGLILLRLDHTRMVELRDAVLEADREGDSGELREALVGLKEFDARHIIVNFVEKNGEMELMFGTGQFYLEHQYNRDAEKALEEAQSLISSDDNPNGNVFKKATDYCDPIAKKYGWGYSKPYFDCIMGELSKYPSMGEIDDARLALVPPVGEYRISLASPVWYPSWSGWVVLGCALLSVVIIIRIFVWLALFITLKIMK